MTDWECVCRRQSKGKSFGIQLFVEIDLLHCSFVMYVPRVYTNRHTADRRTDVYRQRALSELVDQCRDPQADSVRVGFHLQFPELRLIEYDCGTFLGRSIQCGASRFFQENFKCLVNYCDAFTRINIAA